MGLGLGVANPKPNPNQVVYEAPPAAKDPTEAHALCCAYVGHGVISGWSDGIIRFHEAR